MKIIESNLKFGKLSYRNSTVMLILHHAEWSHCTVEDIHREHKNNRHWSGIGYHFFVRKDGSIYRGRPENAMGAHCKGANAHSIGICAEGSYMREIMPQAQKKSIIALGKYLCKKYRIKQVYGHKEVGSSDCPGIKYPLAEIKSSIFSKPIQIKPMPLKMVCDTVAIGFNNGQPYPVKEFHRNDCITVTRIINKLGELNIHGKLGYIPMGYTKNR